MKEIIGQMINVMNGAKVRPKQKYKKKTKVSHRNRQEAKNIFQQM